MIHDPKDDQRVNAAFAKLSGRPQPEPEAQEGEAADKVRQAAQLLNEALSQLDGAQQQEEQEQPEQP